MDAIKRLVRSLVLTQLEDAVKQLLGRNQITVIGVTGSMGKTSTKLAIATVLRQQYRVLAHEGNYNTEFGLPLSLFEEKAPANPNSLAAWSKLLLRIRSKAREIYPYDVVVLEMGADQPGDIGRFLQYIKPSIGVVTAIAPAHIGLFGSIEAIAAEKMLLAASSDRAVLNADDDRIMSVAKSLPVTPATFGIKAGEARAMAVKHDQYGGLSFTMRYQGKVELFTTKLIARHGLYAVGAAVKVAELLEVRPDLVQKGVSEIAATPGRMQLLDGLKGSQIIDDSYNANPEAVLAALGTLLEARGKHIAVLGSMNELGEYSKDAHERIGKACGSLSMLVTIGAEAEQYMAPAAHRAGLKKSQIHSFMSPYEAGEFVKTKLTKDSVVLIKGSQNGVFSEEAASILLASEADKNKLVRQSPEWLMRKHAQFGRAS